MKVTTEGPRVDSNGSSSFVVENDGKEVDILEMNSSSNRLDTSCGRSESTQPAAEETHSPMPAGSSSAPNQNPVETNDASESETLADVVVLVCVFVGNLLYGIDLSGFGIFYKHLIDHFDASAAAVGWCSSINGFFQGVTGLFVSHPIKLYGCRLPGCFGSLVAAIGHCLCSLAPNLATIYFLYGIATGIGTGLSNLASSVIVYHRFTRNRILATGIAWLGTSVGLAVGSAIVSSIAGHYGWRAAFLVLGAVQANRIPLCLFFRSPEKFTKEHGGTEDDSANTCGAFLRYVRDSFDFRLLRHLSFSLYTAAHSLQLAGATSYLPHAFNRALSVGLSHPEAILAASLASGTTVVARTAVSLVANRAKIKTAVWFAVGMFLSALSVAFLFALPEPYATMSSTVIFGFHLACTTTFSSMVVVEIMGVDVLPRCLAILLFLGSISRLGAAPAVGWVYNMTGSYNYAYLLVGCWGLIGGVLMVVEVILDRRKSKFTSSESQK